MSKKCIHIIGFELCSFPQYGEQDHLIYADENNWLGPNFQEFSYCPLCGKELIRSAPIETTTTYGAMDFYTDILNIPRRGEEIMPVDFVKDVLPVLEFGLNTALLLTGVPGGAALASSLEASLNPLLADIKSNKPVGTDVMAAFGATIGVLNAIKTQPGVDPAKLAKATEYLAATQDAVSAYMLAGSGLDLSKLTPVTPIV